MAHSDLEIYEVGKTQSAMMYLVLVNILGVFFAPNVTAFIGLCSIYFAYKLASDLKYPVPWLLSIIMLVPLINLLYLFILVNSATKLLRTKNIRVGLMGASRADLEKLKASSSAPKALPTMKAPAGEQQNTFTKPQSSMTSPLEILCASGEKADRLMEARSFDNAIDRYNEIIDVMFNETKSVDSFILAKATLGLLTATTLGKKSIAACEIWTADSESKLGMGISLIENAQTSTNDLMVYFSICAYLHSLAIGDPDKQADAVNSYMTKVCTYFQQEKLEELPQSLSNWLKFIAQVYEDSEPVKSPPPEKTAVLKDFVKKYMDMGYNKPQIVDIALPKLSLWEITW